ncbi:MAG: hypothetical protein ACLR2E_06550 [Lachnospiraceae bacterium]
MHFFPSAVFSFNQYPPVLPEYTADSLEKFISGDVFIFSSTFFRIFMLFLMDIRRQLPCFSSMVSYCSVTIAILTVPQPRHCTSIMPLQLSALEGLAAGSHTRQRFTERRYLRLIFPAVILRRSAFSGSSSASI